MSCIKKIFFLIAFLITGISLHGQDVDGFIKGNINYISSQNVYVQFVNTDRIEVGDTLFSVKNDIYIPVLIVKNKSTISCTGRIIGNFIPVKSNQV